jgi:hypothetical protein
VASLITAINATVLLSYVLALHCQLPLFASRSRFTCAVPEETTRPLVYAANNGSISMSYTTRHWPAPTAAQCGVRNLKASLVGFLISLGWVYCRWSPWRPWWT